MFKDRICAHGLLPAVLRPTPFVSTMVYFCLAYFSCFQFVSHFTIALNRYTVMVLPTVHSRIWSGKWLYAVVSLIVLMPGAFALVRFFMQCDVVDNPDGYGLSPTNKFAAKISGYIQVSVSLSTCLLSCALEYGTFFAFRKMSLSCKKKYGEDYRLLLYAMMGFFAHMIMASVYVFVYVVGGLPGFLFTGYAYFVDILCLGGPVCLFYTSKHLRRKYLEFYGLRNKSSKEVTVTRVQTTKVVMRR
ncbi:hypothetical protein AAVH_14181 [Aphelenchoides avenae]|nr:hypothetical protein AAVH_14181 [Aphelenchus avenae]